jgi:tRNA threonylcarbamoyladenosine biosynthesis protein TsaE
VLKKSYFCTMENPLLTLRFRDLSELDGVASQLLDFGGEVPVWLFEGAMGVGKTTLIKKLCEQLGVNSVVQSPTFALVNEYATRRGDTVYHFDFYRIKNETEALDMGIEEYFYSGELCLVEWPGRVASLWPDRYLQIGLLADDTGERTLRAAVISNEQPTT